MTEATPPDPYDEVPYLTTPAPWTAPERIALASRLHGGPTPRLDGARVLELGCGDGRNLVPLAAHRPEMTFVGLDGSEAAIGRAHAAREAVGLRNLDFVLGRFDALVDLVEGDFDVIILHGVLSWVGAADRERLLRFCADRLADEGLVFASYNALPGWKARGVVRRLLLAHLPDDRTLRGRAEAAKALAGRLADDLTEAEHPYSRLLAHELGFVAGQPVGYVAHEFLAEHNHAFWQSEIEALTVQFGLHFIADADFDDPTRNVQLELPEWLEGHGLSPSPDLVDLFAYRQFRCGVFSKRRPEPLDVSSRLSGLSLATPLVRKGQGEPAVFEHPSGAEVEVDQPALARALAHVRPRWPQGIPLAALFPEPAEVADDLLLLQRHGVITLRLHEPAPTMPEALVAWEAATDGHLTSPYHTRLERAGSDQD